jgi:Na+/melibiose symporter-like transporter
MTVSREITATLAGVSGRPWPVRHLVTPRDTVTFIARASTIRRPLASGGNDMIELLEQQKKLTANQWKLICTANIADLLDFFDFFLIGYVTAALTKQWSLTYWEGGSILLASVLGAVPGAFFWGWLGDRIGRRTVFMLSAITISLATGVMVFTPGPDGIVPGWAFLMSFRFFVGVGNAGFSPSTYRWCRSLSPPTSAAGSAP